jgi:uncharacterized membrane protein
VLVSFVHTVHVLLAGAWFGGVLFTTLVVSPALRAMKWGEAERVGVRAVIGRRYARVGSINLALLAAFALLDGALEGFGTVLYGEYVLLLLLFGLVAAHGAFFGRRIAGLAEAERGSTSAEEAASLARRRRSLQSLSLKVSWVNLAVSAAVVALAANA